MLANGCGWGAPWRSQFATLLALVATARAGVFDPATACPSGSKMTDYTFDFTAANAPDQWTFEGGSQLYKTAEEKTLFKDAAGFVGGRMLIKPRMVEGETQSPTTIWARTVKRWHPPCWVAIEGTANRRGQAAAFSTEYGFTDESSVDWTQVSFSDQTPDGRDFFWIRAEANGKDANKPTPPINFEEVKLNRNAHHSDKSGIETAESSDTINWDSAHFTDVGDHSTWTAYMRWMPSDLVVGYLDPVGSANYSLTYKKSELELWPTGASGGQSLVLQASIREPPTTPVQVEGWSATRIQVSGCLVDGDGRIEAAIAQTRPVAKLATALTNSNSVVSQPHSPPPSSSPPASATPTSPRLTRIVTSTRGGAIVTMTIESAAHRLDLSLWCLLVALGLWLVQS